MYERYVARTISGRISEPRRFIQVVAGPRQTGKTTAIRQAVKQVDIPCHVASADGLSMRGPDWIGLEWQQARQLCTGSSPAVLVLDEIQKAGNWSETVKCLWDEDTWNELPLHVVLSGSSALLLQSGLSESLAGRFEMIRSTHWSLSEMHAAFGYTLDDYLMFGGYPGSAPIHENRDRWVSYMRDSIIESTLSKDVLLMEDIRKPSLLRRLFELGAQYSSQEISYRNLLGQLDDKGNTATLAHYLDLLAAAGMLCGLQKYESKALNIRRSSPRLLVFDTSLMTAVWESAEDLLSSPSARGHLVESSVGASLLARSQREGFELFWWRDGNHEVDFVAKKGERLAAIEVKSGKVGKTEGLAEFCKRYPGTRPLVVGGQNLTVERFLMEEPPLF